MTVFYVLFAGIRRSQQKTLNFALFHVRSHIKVVVCNSRLGHGDGGLPGIPLNKVFMRIFSSSSSLFLENSPLSLFATGVGKVD